MPEEQVKLARERGFLPEQQEETVVEAAPEVVAGEQQAPEQEAALEAAPSNVVQLADYRPKVAAAVIEQHKDQTLEQIEHVLSDGLKDVYAQLPPNKQRQFRVQGEAAARQIRQMVAGGKPRSYKLVKLVDSWLKLIPNVNRYYLRQETKRKVDRLQEIAHQGEHDIGRLAA